MFCTSDKAQGSNGKRAAKIWLAIFWLLFAGLTAQAAELTAEKTEHGATVKIDGQPFAQYLIQSGKKPIVWPIIGPTGQAFTRAYPMREVEGEKTRDHVHHRSLWFTHGDVNGISFWESGPEIGSVVHREFTEISSGSPAIIATRNDWLAVGGAKQCEDERRLSFASDGSTRSIDFDITIRATEGDVKFGDTKEGTFSVRVADSIAVDAKQGGRIVNSEGQHDGAAWGQAAPWVDYQGPIEGQTVGIAIMNHPSSFRYPTHWHVRTYGLFAANPFGLHDFTNAPSAPYTLKQGESMSLRYRVVLHTGDEKEARIAERFAEYAKSK